MNCNREYNLYARGESLTPDIVDQISFWLNSKGLIGTALRYGVYDGRLDETNEGVGAWESARPFWWGDDNGNGYQEDMTDLSRAFPDITFCLNAEGSEHDDIWDCYWLNGDCEMCWGSFEIPEPVKIKW